MVLQKVPRQPALDGLDLFRRLDLGKGTTPLADSRRIDAVIAQIRSNLERHLLLPSVVRGWRAQSLFASLVAALDSCDFMTLVDIGEIYFDGDSVKAPDFFLHLRDGERILVDVKDVQLADPSLEHLIKFGAAEVLRMRRFGEMYGAEVLIAIYIADFPMWFMVSLSDLEEGPGGGHRISLRDAIFKNKLAMIGDQSIGVRAPLEAVFLPAPGSRANINEKGEAPFTVGAVHLYSGGTLVTSPEARRIVWFFMMYGGWEQDECVVAADGRITELRWTSSPPEETGQGFDIIGSLSAMYSRLFESSTSGPGGYTALDLSVEPGTLITLLPHDFRDDELSLWRFTLVPTDPKDADE